jgi:DNA polymerase elongation subunit (family B)
LNKTFLYDLETTANKAYVWGKYDQNVIAFIEEWKLLSISYKELGGKTQFFGLNTMSEKELVKKLHQLFDEADILIAHNGDKFDVKKANAKFLEFGLLPPSPYKTIDTLKVAKRVAKFNSNKLNDVAQVLGLGRKVETGGFDLWLGCENNDPKSWKLMEKYNKQDVNLLEKVYLRLRPWITNHPYTGGLCNNCSGTHFQSRGQLITKKRIYQRLQCQTCGSWSQV